MSVPPFDPAGTLGAITASWDMTAVVDQRLEQIYAYWRSRCRPDRKMPSRTEIDPPLGIPAVLKHVFLVDVLSDPRDFRFRLAGTHFAETLLSEVTGKLIGDVFPPDFCSEVHYYWSECINRRAPGFGSGTLWVVDRDYIKWNGVVCPLSPDDAFVNMLLGGAIFTTDRQ